jgi:hypothetical protein
MFIPANPFGLLRSLSYFFFLLPTLRQLLCPLKNFIHDILSYATDRSIHRLCFCFLNMVLLIPGLVARTQAAHIFRCKLKFISLCLPLHYVVIHLSTFSVHSLPIIWRALRPASAAGLLWFLSSAHNLLKPKTHTKPWRMTYLPIALSGFHG